MSGVKAVEAHHNDVQFSMLCYSHICAWSHTTLRGPLERVIRRATYVGRYVAYLEHPLSASIPRL
jgi:hypothetical protein